jgi:hypothetical protein
MATARIRREPLRCQSKTTRFKPNCGRLHQFNLN